MTAKEYVCSLFSGYEETGELNDFQEELQSNLEDRISYLKEKGMNEKEAFDKATSELGDVSEIAEEMSFSRKKEVFESMYMKTRNYISALRMAAFIGLGCVIVFACMIAGLSYGNGYSIGLIPPVLIFLFALPGGFITYLALTQETARKNPMKKLRAAAYGISVFVFLIGPVLALFFYLKNQLADSVFFAGIFVIPAIVVLLFLILTEKNRNKLWVVEEQNKWANEDMNPFADPKEAMRFGLLSAVLWIFSLALFITLGFIIGFQYSWVVFVFAVAAEVLLTYLSASKK